jgi:hypothetical protein
MDAYMARGHRQRGAVTELPILFACCACAFALDSSLGFRQYAHNAWKIREGFSEGSARAITQTPEEYLWPFGLLRFENTDHSITDPFGPGKGDR